MKLGVLKRSQQIQEIDLGSDVLAQDSSEAIFLIGRSKECHIVLDDKKISREHAKLIHKNSHWRIEKVSPENNCQINGENFDSHELESGDVFTVEGFSIVFSDIKKSESIVQISGRKIETSAVAAVDDFNDFIEQPSQKNIEQKSNVIDEVDVRNDVKNREDQHAKNAIAEFDIDVSSDPEETIDANSTREIGVEEYNLDKKTSNEDSEFLDEPSEEINLDMALAEARHDISDSKIVINESSQIASSETEENLSYSLENIDSGNDDDSTRVIQSFATIHLELFGETAPYDRYIIEKEKTFIGRDPRKCQIILNDTEVSTVHAVITRNNILLTLEDLNSSNGTIYNGDRVNKVALNHNDEFVIGGVTFTVKVRSEFLKEESATLMAVDENQTVEVEEIVEVEADEGDQFDALGDVVSNEPPEKSILKRIWKDEAQRKKLIYVLVAGVLMWVLFGEEDKKDLPQPKAKVTEGKKAVPTPRSNGQSKKLSEEQRRSLSATYEIGKAHYNNGRYREALSELQKIAAIDPNFNPSLQSLIALSKEGLQKIEDSEKERLAKIQAAERKAKVLSLLETAREYTRDRRVDLANSTFNEITQIDPENFEVSKMKLELEDWQKERQRKELEEVQKKKEREDKVEKLKPGRSLFLQNEWFKAISKLEDFLRIKDMDDDLTTEATDMLKKSREELSSAVAPLIGKAKSLLEGQDLKSAYEVYQQILRIEPSNTEALNQISDIRDQLTIRARKIYREAIIAESLTLFQDAKEKFQEVQQISPVDTDYYKKATEKLKNYLE
ncbi:MAG: FHA domain-containing protein [Bacteriovoracaceae bacterium]|nr:FHA domain-containing protein [Bacteriovoracaceae bacterium]